MKKWLPPTLLLTILIIVACTPPGLENEQKELIKELDQQPSCPDGQILSEGRCCDDTNGNGQCDSEEPYCGDDVCNGAETSCTCSTDCGVCDGTCEDTVCTEVNDTVDKTPVETNTSAETQLDLCTDRVCQDTESCSLCAIDCCSISQSLADYPDIVEGMTPVVGDKAPSKDIVTLTQLMFPLEAEGISTKEQRLASETAGLDATDYLLVGSPCDNVLVEEIYKNRIQTIGSCEIFEPGLGVLRIVPTSPSTIALIITGNTADDVEKAASALNDYKNNTLTGTEYTVS